MKWSLSIVCLCLCGAVNAAESLLRATPFREILLPEAEISGALVVGVQRRDVIPGQIDIQADIPAEVHAGPICLRVTSIDGRYAAELQYALPPADTAMRRRLEFPTQHADMLANYRDDQLALGLRPGSCGPDSQEVVMVAGWNRVQGPVDILINSFRSDRVFAYIGSDVQPIVCQKIDSLTPTAFDTVCRVAELNDTKVAIEIHRIKGQNQLPPTHLSLWLAER